MNNKMIFPSCSEIVWRLEIPTTTKEKIIKALENKEEEYPSTYMASDFPNKFLGIMINCLKKEEKKGCGLNDIKLKMVANDNGENWGFIKEGFRLAKLCLNKEMDRKEAQKILWNIFDEEREEEMNEILNPSCSEIVWRLSIPATTKEKILKALEGEEEVYRTETDTFPNGCLSNMINLLKEAKGERNINEIGLIFIDNIGGGGNGQFVEDCFNIAKIYLEGKITKKEAEKLENKCWHKKDDE